MKKRYIGRELHRVENQLKRHMDAIAAKNNTTIVQHILLGFVSEHEKGEGVLQKEIEAYFDIRRSTVSYILGLLEEKQLIVRERVPGDARQKRLRLTKEGQALYETLESAMQAEETAFSSLFSPGEEALFYSFLDRLSLYACTGAPKKQMQCHNTKE